MTNPEEFAQMVRLNVARHLLDVAACNAFNAGMGPEEIRDLAWDAVSTENGGDGGRELAVISPECCLLGEDAE